MFRHLIIPKPGDIDMMGHVNNVVYLEYVQEVAEAHWKTKAPKSMQKEILWVVLRYEIDYLKPAFLKDEITGITWVEPAKGPKTIRYVEFRRKTDEAVIASVKTTWCALDASTGKPLRLSEKVMNIFA